eukprot:scaffold81991_cov72-Phaeocystis_antarctica.AAC.11
MRTATSVAMSCIRAEPSRMSTIADMPSSSSASAGRRVASTTAHATVATAAAKSQGCVRCLQRPCSSGIFSLAAPHQNSANRARGGWQSYQRGKAVVSCETAKKPIAKNAKQQTVAKPRAPQRTHMASLRHLLR